MKKTYRSMVVVLSLAGLLLSACAQGAGSTAVEEARPIEIEHLDGAEPTREKVTEEAAKRLDIQTAVVSEMDVNGIVRKVIPYTAVIYDTNGATWVYMNTEPLTFVRHSISVNDIKGNQAFLSDGPSVGTSVVTVGAAELYGAEVEFQEE